GYSVNQLIDGVPQENYAGVLKAGLDNGVAVWSDARAEMIARTETALSFNRAALDGYKEFDVREVQAIAGDGDPECAAREGQPFSVEDALGIEDHPNGTLDWVPIIDKSVHLQPINLHNVVNLPATKIEATPIQIRPEFTIEPTV